MSLDKKSYRLKKSPNEFKSFNDVLIVYNEAKDMFHVNMTVRIKDGLKTIIKKASTKPKSGSEMNKFIEDLKNKGYVIVK